MMNFVCFHLAVTEGLDTAFAGLKKKKKKQVVYCDIS